MKWEEQLARAHRYQDRLKEEDDGVERRVTAEFTDPGLELVRWCQSHADWCPPVRIPDDHDTRVGPRPGTGRERRFHLGHVRRAGAGNCHPFALSLEQCSFSVPRAKCNGLKTRNRDSKFVQEFDKRGLHTGCYFRVSPGEG